MRHCHKQPAIPGAAVAAAAVYDSCCLQQLFAAAVAVAGAVAVAVAIAVNVAASAAVLIAQTTRPFVSPSLFCSMAMCHLFHEQQLFATWLNRKTIACVVMMELF